ncbi:hypothetical protein CDD83_10090 [Cordyceps sp. RAO-2017]|nr:hypothetical protein CDD83_10090 [Cordyceps sp. RAO-2017]
MGGEQKNTPADSACTSTARTDASFYEAELVAALQELIEEHELDQNFPRELLTRARNFVRGRKDGGRGGAAGMGRETAEEVEEARRLVDDFREHKELERNSSAYVEVRAVVDTTDDPTTPVATFRVLVMGSIFAVAGTAMHQFFSLRMPSIHLSTYVVQLLSMPLGKAMARWLPRGRQPLGFSLNPGPFSQKEHLLIAMMANVAFGSHHNGAYITSIVQVLKLDRFYGEKVLANSIPWQLVTLISTQLMGYGCAGLARRFLVYPPAMIWQKALANIALTKALMRDDEGGDDDDNEGRARTAATRTAADTASNGGGARGEKEEGEGEPKAPATPSSSSDGGPAGPKVAEPHHSKESGARARGRGRGWTTMSRYRFFRFCFCAMFAWHFVPNYLFQGLGLSNWPTWAAPGNVRLALIAGSTCGLGLNPLPTLDWNVATYLGDPIVTPLFTLLNFAAGMAVAGFVAAPALYFGNAWNGGHLPINSNKMYDNQAQLYQVHRILGRGGGEGALRLDEAAYRAYSVPWLSTTQLLNMAAYFTMYVAVPVHVGLWFRRDLAAGLRSAWRRRSRAQQFDDVHNRLMSAYPECPHWWYLAVLGASFALACVAVTAWPTGMPVWGIVLAVVFTVLLQVPIGMLAAITNVEIPTSILAMLIGGYALEGRVVANMLFKMFSFMSTSQSLSFVADLKMAHYARIPPRWAFAAQVYATFVAGLVAWAVNHWSLRNIEAVCREGQPDRFVCPHTHSYFLSSVLWGVIGPRRIFGPGGPYRALTYCLPLGLVLPVAVYLASRRWPNSWWRNANAPIFIAGPLGWSPYNWSYIQGSLVLALFFNHFVKRRHPAWWERYAYVLTSSFAAATGLAALVLFFALQKWDIRLDWWGNRIAAQGVDQGGWRDAAGVKVNCTNLSLPPGGHFSSGF